MNKSFFKTLFRRKITYVAVAIIIIFIICALGAKVISPYEPNKMDLMNAHLSPCEEHWLGTDELGRDILTRIIYGSRVALVVGIVAVFSAAVVGSAMGLLAGYFLGWVDQLISRLIETLMSVPAVILGLCMSAVFGGSVKLLIIILGISAIPAFARMTRAQVLVVRELDYVEASRLCGNTSIVTMYRHVLKNCLSPIIVQLSQMIGATILAEAGLSYLGAGIMPPTASWGGMVNSGNAYLKLYPETSIFPGLAIVLLVVAFNILGDSVRDAMDPRLRGAH